MRKNVDRPSIDTQEFMRLMHSGKPEDAADAFNVIYAPAKALCRAACGRTGVFNEDDQLDLFQQTMLDLFRVGWRTFDSKCSLSTFIYGIAVRRCADFHRSKGRNLPDSFVKRASVDSPRAEEGESDLDTEDLHSRKDSFEQRVCAQMAIQELERLYPREAQALRDYVEGALSHDELARLLKLTLASLGNLISRIRRELKRLCHDHCGSADCTAVVTG